MEQEPNVPDQGFPCRLAALQQLRGQVCSRRDSVPGFIFRNLESHGFRVGFVEPSDKDVVELEGVGVLVEPLVVHLLQYLGHQDQQSLQAQFLIGHHSAE